MDRTRGARRRLVEVRTPLRSFSFVLEPVACAQYGIDVSAITPSDSYASDEETHQTWQARESEEPTMATAAEPLHDAADRAAA